MRIRDEKDLGFVVFDTPENGLRALGVNIISKQRKHGAKTLSELVKAWAPSHENDTDMYLKNVAEEFDIDLAKELDFMDRETVKTLMRGIIWRENGKQKDDAPYYSDTQINDTAGVAIEHHLNTILEEEQKTMQQTLQADKRSQTQSAKRMIAQIVARSEARSQKIRERIQAEKEKQ